VSSLDSSPRVGYVSTYPPRGCGIATFTRDLARAVLLRGHARGNIVVAIEDELNPSPVTTCDQIIDQHDRASYVSAAGFLNESNVDVVSLQHEFGIFGGEWGEYVLALCRNVEAPLVTTFHTVLQKPSPKAREIVREVSQLSTTVVVTIESAARLLERKFGVESERIAVIRHGAVAPDRMRRGYARRHFHLQNRTVLTTTGLISAGKGIEYAIRSLPYLVKDRPDVLYLVLGETHPEVRRRDGEAYRGKLISLAQQLKVEHNVRFVDRYLPDDELSLYLQAADIYLAPYLGEEQVSSGTITLALSHGKAVISTPTIFAEEVLSGNRGLFCKFADASSIAECVHSILGDPRLRRKLEANAFKYGQQVGWARVADQYGDIFRSATWAGRALTEAAAVSEA
jgi:glycosyltransferase involved in cell wall biosynthesis